MSVTSTNVVVVDTVAHLKAMVTRPLVVLLLGYWAANDGGGGWVNWRDGDSTTQNNGTIFQCTSGPAGRYGRNITRGGDLPSDYFGVIGDGATRFQTTELQALVNFAAPTGVSNGWHIKLSNGNIKTAQIEVSAPGLVMSGGTDATQIVYDNAAGHCFHFTGGDKYVQFAHFSIANLNNSSGAGACIHLDDAGYLVDSNFTDMFLSGYSDTMVATTSGAFTCNFNNVFFDCTAGNGCRVHCNNTVSWMSCYFAGCGALKAAARLGGNVALYSCNGMNHGGMWGAFGNYTGNPTFGGDFPGNDEPVFTAIACNFESWAGSASHAAESCLYFVNSVRSARIINCSFGRSASTSYYAVIYCYLGMDPDGTPFIISASSWNRGAGTLVSGYALFADGKVLFVDDGGVIAANGDTYSIVNGTNVYPIVTRNIVAGNRDLYLNAAERVSSIAPDRINAGVLGYQTAFPAAGTTTIVVTGLSGFVTANTGATTIVAATFDSSPGTASEGVNGFMIVQCGDTHTTLKHLNGTAGSFKMLGGVDLALTNGMSYAFIFAPLIDGTHYGWKQVA